MHPAGSSPSVQGGGGPPPGGDPPGRPPRQSPCDSLSGALAVFAQGVRAGVSQTLALSSMIAMRLLFRASGDRNSPGTLAAAGAVVLLHDVFSLADSLRTAHTWVHARSTAAGTVAPMAWRHRLLALGFDLAMIGLAVSEAYITKDSKKGESFSSVLVDKAGSLVGIKLRAFVRDLVQTLCDRAGFPRIVVRMPGGGPLPAGQAERLNFHTAKWMAAGYVLSNVLTVLIDSEGEKARSESASYAERRDAMYHAVTPSVVNELAEVLVEVAAMMRFARQERLELFVEIPGNPSMSLREFMGSVYAKSTVRNLILTCATIGGSFLGTVSGHSAKAQAVLGTVGTVLINGGVEVAHPGILRGGAEHLRRADLMRGWVAQAGLEGEAASRAVGELSKHLKEHAFPRSVWDDDDALDAAVRWFAAKDPHQGERLREFQEVSSDARRRLGLSDLARQIVCAVRPDLNTMSPSKQKEIDALQRALLAAAAEERIDDRQGMLAFARDWFAEEPVDRKQRDPAGLGRRAGRATADEVEDRIQAYERALERTPITRRAGARGVSLEPASEAYRQLKGHVLHKLGLRPESGRELDNFVRAALGRGRYFSDDVVLAMSAWATLHASTDGQGSRARPGRPGAQCEGVAAGEVVMELGFQAGLSGKGPIGAARATAKLSPDAGLELVERVLKEAVAQGALRDEHVEQARAQLAGALQLIEGRPVDTPDQLRALYLHVAALATESFGPGIGEAVRHWGYVDGVYGHQDWAKAAEDRVRADDAVEYSQSDALVRGGPDGKAPRRPGAVPHLAVGKARPLKSLLDEGFRGPAMVTPEGAQSVQVQVTGWMAPMGGPVRVRVLADNKAAEVLQSAGAEPEPPQPGDVPGMHRLVVSTGRATVEAVPSAGGLAGERPMATPHEDKRTRFYKAAGRPVPRAVHGEPVVVTLPHSQPVAATVVGQPGPVPGMARVVTVLAEGAAATVLKEGGAMMAAGSSSDPPGTQRFHVRADETAPAVAPAREPRTHRGGSDSSHVVLDMPAIDRPRASLVGERFVVDSRHVCQVTADEGGVLMVSFERAPIGRAINALSAISPNEPARRGGYSVVASSASAPTVYRVKRDEFLQLPIVAPLPDVPALEE